MPDHVTRLVLLWVLFPAQLSSSPPTSVSAPAAASDLVPFQIRLLLPAGSNVPNSVTIELEAKSSPPGPDGTPSRIFTCPTSPRGTALCNVPPGTFRARIASTGFIPHYQEDLSISAEGSTELEPLRLVPGASVSGSVDSSLLAPLPAEAGSVVKLENLAILESRGESRGLASRSLQVEASSDGFFQVMDVPPGLYRLSAEVPDRGRSQSLEIEVLDGRESRLLEPLVMAPLSRFDVQINPPQDPFGHPWQVSLYQRGTSQSAHAEVMPDGVYRVLDLPAGTYELDIKNRRGDRWHSEQVEIFADETLHWIELGALRFRGTLRIGTEPLSAHLWFGGRSGHPRVHAAANQDGVFWGALPRSGTWRIEVQPREQSDHYFDAGEIEVKADPEEAMNLDIRLPDTRLEGVVVDTEGAPVAGAEIAASFGANHGQNGQQKSDAEGRFRFRGLPAGQVLVTALTNSASSQGEVVQLAEDLMPPELRLVLEDGHTLAGQVFSQAGPMPRVRVVTMAELPPGYQGRLPEIEHLTGTNGEFQAVLPARTTGVSLAVLAPGFAGRLLRVPLTSEPLMLAVDQFGGTLHLDVPGPHGKIGLFANGAGVPFLVLRSLWARPAQQTGIPNRVTLSSMEPGTYSLCTSLRPKSDEDCTSGLLPPGGELLLELPTPSTSPRPN